MRLVAPVIFLMVMGVAYAQDKELVCIPCGHPCDGIVRKSGKECPTCRMPLVPKSTVFITNLDARAFCARITENPNAIIIDVRSEKEFNGTSDTDSFGHFKKAININVNELTQQLNKIEKFKDREILVYCSHSYRSPRAAYFLNMQGFKNIKNLSGGVSELGKVANTPCFKENYVSHKK